MNELISVVAVQVVVVSQSH